MVCCYFLATTACKASSSMMRRSFFSSWGTISASSSSIVVEAFVVPNYSTNNNNKNNRRQQAQTKTTFHQFTTKMALSSSSSSSQATKERIIPRPQKVVQTQTTQTGISVNAIVDNPPPLLNLHTITLDELQGLVVSWGYPKFRGKQIYGWIRDKGVTNPNDMNNLPKDLRKTMLQFTCRNNSNDDDDYADSQANDNGGGALSLAFEAVSKDGTIKRAYQLRDGQLIESVLMGPYEDGRYTACISSQAGCAMGCVFCATGQMGFARQLSADEILEQVSRFASELKRGNDPSKRLSNIVFMGMGEPLANYRNVVKAVNRINSELGIGARRITVSTVGVVPSIKKLYAPDTEMPQVRLAVSLHCADDAERTKLLPANERYGGLNELMVTLKEYIDTTGRRVTLEWALIAHQNDGIDTARQLGNLVRKYGLRRDMIHVNVIPLNPTQGFEGAKPSNVKRVNAFCDCLKNDYGISATPRVRRGIDIDAGCGQLKAKIQKREQKKEQQQLQQETIAEATDTATLADFLPEPSSTVIGVYDDYGNDNDNDDDEEPQPPPPPTNGKIHQPKQVVEFTLADDAVDFEFDDFENPEYEADSHDMAEALRLVAMVEKGAFATTSTAAATSTAATSSSTTVEVDDSSSSPVKGPTTTIIDADAVRVAKKKRKKLLRNLKQIQKLKDMKASGQLTALSKEQLEKIGKEEAWRNEVEDLEHNLKS
mmetsp:Transcript_26214/g.56221  ORF Transcript_26214/g.56221 Transcript_26214/m.56221 type:complete len:712 (-) Transcript_26214:45-2180(-)